MRLITGDECGLLKECIPELARTPEDKYAPIKPHGAMPTVTRDGVCRIDPKELQTRSRGIVDMMFTNQEDGNFSFCALRQNGSVELWKGSADKSKHFGQYDNVYTTKNVFNDLKSEDNQHQVVRPLGIGFFAKQGRICAGDMLGNLTVSKIDSGKVVETFNAYKTSKRGKNISYTPGNNVNKQLATAFACDSGTARVAVGGRERETTVLDLSTGTLVFKAKNLPPDPQTLLQQPVWPSAIQFLDTNVMAVGTAYKQVRIYDVREQSKTRRPIATTPDGLLEYRVTSLCQASEYEVVVGDAAGNIYNLDIRTLGKNPKSLANKNVGRYVGPAGSVRQLKKHPTLPRLAAVGLDRMLRIYDTKTRKQLDCIYLKQRLNCVLFGADDTWEIQGNAGDGIGDDDLGDWDQDDVVQDYVDSDEDDDKNQSLAEELSDDNSQSPEEQANSGEEELDGDEKSTDASSVSGQNSSSDDVDSDNEELDATSDNDDDSEEDEEIVMKAPKKRRRR